METVWIIGGGQFGKVAVNRLKKKFRIVSVDMNKSLFPKMEGISHTFVQHDGVQYLLDNLNLNTDVSWIIPALPVHLAWEWCRRKIGLRQLKPHILPDEILSFLPHPVRGESSHIYTSHADFICPDYCNEPDRFCTHTGKPRKQDMDQFLKSLSFEVFKPIVLKSQQLAPGVGGYQPEDLYSLLEKIKLSNGPLLICTACRCHGVVTGAVHQ